MLYFVVYSTFVWDFLFLSLSFNKPKIIKIVKQNFYEPGMPSDLLFNNNVPVGVWDDPEENSPFSEFQDIEDYPQYYQPPCSYTFNSKMFHNPFECCVCSIIFYIFSQWHSLFGIIFFISFGSKLWKCVCDLKFAFYLRNFDANINKMNNSLMSQFAIVNGIDSFSAASS